MTTIDSTDTALHYIALLPDPETSDRLLQFQREARDKFNSKHAMRSPPHITLEPPFKLEPDRQYLIEEEIETVCNTQCPFKVELNGFAHFPARVIYVHVTENPSLTGLQHQLKIRLRESFGLVSERPDRPFKPHITIAFRDLNAKMFAKAKRYFSSINYYQSFLAQRIALLTYKEKRWQIEKEFGLDQVF